MRIKAGIGIALAMSTALALAAITAPRPGPARASGPLIQASQFKTPQWYCSPKKYGTGGESTKHKRASFGDGGGRFYFIKLDASIIRCGDKTQIQYKIFAATPGFPGNRHVFYRVASAGSHKKFKKACVRFDGKTSCEFRIDGDKKIPIPGASGILQYRGKGIIRYVRLFHYAAQGEGGAPISVPQTITIKLDPYYRRPKSLWPAESNR